MLAIKFRNLRHCCPTTCLVCLPWRVPVQPLSSVCGSPTISQERGFKRFNLFLHYHYCHSFSFIVTGYFLCHSPIQQFGKRAHLCVGAKQRKEGNKGGQEMWGILRIQERLKACWNHFPRFPTSYYIEMQQHMPCLLLTVSLCVRSFSRTVIDDPGSVLYPTCEFIPPSALKQPLTMLVHESRAENAVTL